LTFIESISSTKLMPYPLSIFPAYNFGLLMHELLSHIIEFIPLFSLSYLVYPKLFENNSEFLQTLI